MQILTPTQLETVLTARFSGPAHSMQRGLPTIPVRVKFMYTVLNVYHGRNEPIFACFLDDDDSSLIGTYFENALFDFTFAE